MATMQRLRSVNPLALALPFVVAAAAAMAAPPTPFDGTYRGQMEVTPSGASNLTYTNPACEWKRPAEMSIREGYVLIWYKDWHRHTIHYKGEVGADGAVKARHHNGDGSWSVLDGRISGNQLTADMLRGRCQYSLQLSRE